MKTSSTWDVDCAGYNYIPFGSVLQKGDEFKRKRNKEWRPVPKGMIGHATTKRHGHLGFFFRRPDLANTIKELRNALKDMVAVYGDDDDFPALGRARVILRETSK